VPKVCQPRPQARGRWVANFKALLAGSDTAPRGPANRASGLKKARAILNETPQLTPFGRPAIGWSPIWGKRLSCRKALSETLDKPIRLKTNQWASSHIVWLMAVAGDRRAIPKFLEQLKEKEFKDREVKMRVNAGEGKVAVKTL
jgi:hypothetical protein